MMIVDEASNDSYCSNASQLTLATSRQIKERGQGNRTRGTKRQTSRLVKRKLSVVLDATMFEAPTSDAILANFYHCSCGAEEVDALEKLPYIAANFSTTPHTRFVLWTRDNFSSTPIDVIVDERDLDSCEPYILIICANEEFLEFVTDSVDGVEFPVLGNYLKQLFDEHFAFVRSKILREENQGHSQTCMIALVNIEATILKLQRALAKRGSTTTAAAPPPNLSIGEMVDSAVSYLLLEFKIEVFRCKKASELSDYIHTLTRLIDQRKPCGEVVSEIDYVSRGIKEKVPEELVGKEREMFELRQTWAAMLQMIPLMSRDKVQAFIRQSSAVDTGDSASIIDSAAANSSNTCASNSSQCMQVDNDGSCYAYSCPSKLFDVFHGNTDPEISQLPAKQQMLLLQGAFGTEKKSGTTRNHSKLSKQLYNLMTALEPEGLIADL
mmetsp:Transcript_6581/g.11046  ORF Transcript_6581/g.11046 Transcript_6581/m.11046 type:complete len:439 (-) Transcript_6581:46-1362(-)